MIATDLPTECLVCTDDHGHVVLAGPCPNACDGGLIFPEPDGPAEPPARGRPGLVTGLVLLAFALACALVPQVADGAAVVTQVVHDVAHAIGHVLASVWNFLVALAP